MKKYFVSTIAIIIFSFSPLFAKPIIIAASLPDLGSIASYLGGDKVEVFSIAKSYSNPHFVEVLPSYMIKVSRAKIYLKVGLSLDQWADQIIDGSRNNNLISIDCSKGVSVLEKPASVTTALAAQGDVHPQGNPHYWLDPSNGIIIANNILEGLKKVDPANSEYYDKNFNNFKTETEKRLAGWKLKMSPLAGKKMIGYHSSWVYFASAFNIDIAGYVEPLPGIPPTGKHLDKIVNIIRDEKVSFLIQEPYFPDDAPNFLARQTGIEIIKVSPSCADAKPDSYFKSFDKVINLLTGR